MDGKGGFAVSICIHLPSQPLNSQRTTAKNPTLCAKDTLSGACHTSWKRMGTYYQAGFRRLLHHAEGLSQELRRPTQAPGFHLGGIICGLVRKNGRYTMYMKTAERAYNKRRILLPKRHQAKLNKLKENPRSGCIMHTTRKRKNRRFRRNIHPVGTASATGGSINSG